MTQAVMNIVAALGQISKLCQEGWTLSIRYEKEHPKWVAVLDSEQGHVIHRNYGIVRVIEGIARETYIHPPKKVG